MLLDHLGNPIPTRPRRTLKPRVRKAPRRVPSKATETARRNLAPATHVEVFLAAKHNLSDHVYGPGRVVVPSDVAKVLLENDGRAAWTDHNFSSTKACIIGPGRNKGGLSVTEVAPEYFDMQHLSAIPFGVVDRRTAAFTAY